MSQWDFGPQLTRILQLTGYIPGPDGRVSNIRSTLMTAPKVGRPTLPASKRQTQPNPVPRKPVSSAAHVSKPFGQQIAGMVLDTYNNGYPRVYRKGHFTIEDLPVRIDDPNPRSNPYLRPDHLGFISGDWETRGGQQLVSSGANDPLGGMSYGMPQFPSKRKGMTKFIESTEAEPLKKEFAKFVPGSKQSHDQYLKIVKGEKSTILQKAEHDYAVRTHYVPVADYAKSLGFNVNDRAIQEVLYSMAIQHGLPNSKRILNAVNADGMDGGRRDLIRRLYLARAKAFPQDWVRYEYEAPKVLEFDSAQHPDEFRNWQADRLRRSRARNSSRGPIFISGGGGAGGGGW